MSLINIIKSSFASVIQPILPGEGPPIPSLPSLVLKNLQLARSLGLPLPSSRPADVSQRILDSAHQKIGTRYQWGGESSRGMDCSHFAHQVYQEAGISYPYTPTWGNWEKAGFEKTENPRRGDFILWKGHMGIVVDPENKIFIGAQSSTGVAEASYADGKYWGKRDHYFLRKT